MTEIRSSQAGLEDPDQLARNGHVSKNHKRNISRSDESSQLPSASNEPESRPPSKSSAEQPIITDVSEAAATFRQAFPGLYGARTPSNRSSSSSLQALNEGIVVDVRSESGSIGRSTRRTSRHSDHQLPVYPDQSYASLQSQVHPTWQPPHLIDPDPLPRHSYARGIRTAGNTPLSSPGLFSMRHSRMGTPTASDDDISMGSSLLHPSHLQPPKETHTAEVDRDMITGNKTINQYEILEELGRGEHGKVKLGQHVATKQKVAIKIVQRYSTRRRLGKLGNPEDKVKKEVAILKKARHPNVVSLLEVIDDPNRQKVYIVLEYVENGEIVWRKKGLREIVHVDKLRLEREKNGIPDTPAFLEESHQFIRTAQHLRRQRERARERIEAQAADAQQGPIPAWSLEHGAESSEEEDDEGGLPIRRSSSRSVAVTDDSSPSFTQDPCLNAVEGSMYVALGYAPSEPEWSAEGDDMAFVPCLTIAETRSAFRDSVLGLEYLHYQGIIHRDIKPANLLVTSTHRVKISDFGVSYLGRPMRDEEEEQVGETDATELDDARELSKTITGAVDVWSLGVTLYGMIFGRLPFVSDDGYSMFQTIVKKEVFIPRKRLVPVMDEASDSNQWNLRNDDELVYEDIDDELYDLLRRLLTKDPIKRITLKEIKHHPWTLHGLPNPRIWIEETDPGYQSKGKRIEVSNEEVTSAVSKVPFIQRVRSNVAKWFGSGRSKDKESQKRTSSTTPSTETLSSAASNSTFGKTSRDSRRSSLRGDEELFRPLKFGNQGHPLAQSVTASPVDEGDWASYFDAVQPAAAKLAAATKVATPPPIVTPRPGPPRRAKSSMSTSESAKTVKPSSFDTPLTVRPFSIIEALGPTNLGSLFSGATRRASRGSRSRRTSPSGETRSLHGDGERPSAGPSIAVSNASAHGQVRTPGLWHEEEHPSAEPVAPSHANRCIRPPQLEDTSPAESLSLTRDALLRRRRSDIEASEGGTLRVDYAMYSTESLLLPPINPPTNQGCPDNTNNGLAASTSATISSSSADDFTSGMSQSASHPSIPSVVSNASSLSGDGYSVKGGDLDEVPSMLRTGETLKPPRPNSPRSSEEDESRYYCDDEDEDESEDEGLVIGKRKPPPKAAASDIPS
ncbi:Calcium/calmodulin-dependent/calcium-dependent protein kinase [Penicillium expansum]|nr:Calcium/calmodulin-dependent/calcium-dependent protein kinase [Penicillium expansum]